MKLELKKSIIHGTGVFTKNYIEKGEVIDESFIHKLSKEEWKLLNNNHYANVLDGTYCRFLVKDYHIIIIIQTRQTVKLI